MPDIQDELPFQCPYCGINQLLLVDFTGGTNQSFITDCETCCQPIRITITEDEDGEPTIVADRE